jgi:WD40 repeat protein
MIYLFLTKIKIKIGFIFFQNFYFLFIFFRSVEFDPTSNYIVTSSFDCSVCVYDIVNKKIEARI